MEHFKFEGRVNGATKGSIEIDRDRGVLHVRPFRQRTYSLRIEDVAALVVSRVVKNELADQGRPVPVSRKIGRRERDLADAVAEVLVGPPEGSHE